MRRTAFAVAAVAVAAALLGAAALGSGSGSGDEKILASWTLTPGVRNPDVTQETIATTICVSGWTKTIRPKTSYTDKLKLTQIKQYHAPVDASYEEDHLIPLELGGHPSDPKNLWPEQQPRAREVVDGIETALKRQVCAGRITLAQAQTTIVVLKHSWG